MPLRLLPVIDLLHHQVVRGVGGRRDEYRPIRSCLTASVQVDDVASALLAAFQPSEIYIADLDAIQARPVAVPISIPNVPVPIWLDAGVFDVASAMRVADTGAHVVAGLETVPSPEMLREILKAVSPERVVFSLDLKAGVPLRTWPGFDEPLAIAREAIRLGVRRLIVLDLARVGEGHGTGTEQWCRPLAKEFPDLDLIAGGGISSEEEIQQLAEWGVTGVLVASALHDGRIKPRNYSSIRSA